jgi:AcrR family transcriptional regulator
MMSQAVQTKVELDLEARILTAAERLRLRSPDTLTMRQLAEEAGVSRATLYRCFPGQKVLLQRLDGRRAQNRPPARLRTSLRQRILRAAREVTADKGLLACTIEQIAEQAGVSAVSVYRVFGDKESLLRAVFVESAPRRDARASLKKLDAPIEPTLIRFTTAILEFFDREPQFVQVMLFSSGAEREYLEVLRSRQEGLRVQLVRYLDAQMKRGRLRAQPVEPLAHAFQGMVLGTFLVRLSGRASGSPSAAAGEKTTAEERAKSLVELFLNGARHARQGGRKP